MLNYKEDNEAQIVGEAITSPVFSHSVQSEKFYNFYISSSRLSENCDVVLVTVSERLISETEIKEGTKLSIIGQFRSYNNYGEAGNRLILTLFARELSKSEDEPINEIYLNGFICKEPVYRVTPFGREISDILLAVNRAYNKSDYIPCIVWGRNARFVKNLSVGQNIKIYGRMQSRQYQKKLPDGTSVTKTAYEVSVSRLETV